MTSYLVYSTIAVAWLCSYCLWHQQWYLVLDESSDCLHLSLLCCRAGFSWCEAPLGLSPCEAPLPLLRGNNGTALISLRKAEDNDTDALKVRSTKNCKSLPECLTITALVAAFDAKAFSDAELLKSYLDGGNRIITFCRQINRKRLG